MGSAFILYMEDPYGFRGSSGAEGPPWSARRGLDFITQASGQAWQLVCLSKNSAQDTCWQVWTPATDTWFCPLHVKGWLSLSRNL